MTARPDLEEPAPDPDEPAPDAWSPAGPLAEGQPRGVLVDEVRRALRVVPADAAVLVACSGGPDSTALAYLTAEARPDLALTVGHVRHGLRDDAPDEQVVAQHARWLGAPLEVSHVHVSGEGGTEAAARAHRYAALRRQAATVGAGWILLGHSAEDQAETVLLRMLRGTGVAGLAAMAPVRGGLVRPLLRLRRNDLARFVLHEGLPVARDPTNEDPSVARVRLRQQVLPVLRSFGGDPVRAVARLADLARADAEVLDRLAAEVTARSLVHYGPAVAIRDDLLASLEPALAARVLREAVGRARATDAPPTAAQIADLADLGVGAAVDLPDLTATRGGGWIALVARDLRPPPVRRLELPGVTRWEAAGLDVVCSTEEPSDSDGQLRLLVEGGWSPPDLAPDPHAVPPGADPELATVVVGALPPSPVVRPRRPGDRVRTAGGTRKLQDVFVDAGVPRAVRDVVPVVAAGDHVLWVPGLAVDEELAQAGRTAPRASLAVRAHGSTVAFD